MTGIIKVNELQGRTTASNITVTDGSTTMQLQLGLAKYFIHFGMNDFVIDQSFNSASVVDEGVGHARLNFTNNMANSNYTGTFCSGYTTIDDASLYAVKYNAPNTGIATNRISFTWYYGSHGTTSKQAADCSHIGMQVAGDLA